MKSDPRRSRGRTILLALATMTGALWLGNTSLFTPPASNGPPKVLSHRGVHQTFHRKGLERDTCTASRIHPPSHHYIENTIESMAAAFDAGAEIVELDIHLTPGGEFAVFHDWTLDCRTNGTGATHETQMFALKKLDIGFGYTADGGATFPLRGRGIGMMPTLSEVLNDFPGRLFLINFKGSDPEEGRALATMLNDNPAWRSRVWAVYGADQSSKTTARLVTDLPFFSKSTVKACLGDYALWGWTGYVPDACRDTILVVPISHAWLLWGWPHKFEKRMKSVETTVILVGPYNEGGSGTSGIDSQALARQVPEGFGGYVWTNKVEVIAPFLRSR